jgi:hypothetical protein
VHFSPKPGLVLRYDFLWKDEQIAGKQDGSKDRPCAVVLVSSPKTDGSVNVVVCPVTHAIPNSDEGAVEIPYKVARPGQNHEDI